MEVLFLLIMCASNIVCFMVGARVGQKVVKDEQIALPTLDPMKVARDRRAQKEEERVRSKMEAILQNIETYNGTAVGQKDIPG